MDARSSAPTRRTMAMGSSSRPARLARRHATRARRSHSDAGSGAGAPPRSRSARSTTARSTGAGSGDRAGCAHAVPGGRSAVATRPCSSPPLSPTGSAASTQTAHTSSAQPAAAHVHARLRRATLAAAAARLRSIAGLGLLAGAAPEPTSSASAIASCAAMARPPLRLRLHARAAHTAAAMSTCSSSQPSAISMQRAPPASAGGSASSATSEGPYSIAGDWPNATCGHERHTRLWVTPPPPMAQPATSTGASPLHSALHASPMCSTNTSGPTTLYGSAAARALSVHPPRPSHARKMKAETIESPGAPARHSSAPRAGRSDTVMCVADCAAALAADVLLLAPSSTVTGRAPSCGRRVRTSTSHVGQVPASMMTASTRAAAHVRLTPPLAAGGGQGSLSYATTDTSVPAPCPASANTTAGGATARCGHSDAFSAGTPGRSSGGELGAHVRLATKPPCGRSASGGSGALASPSTR